MQAFFDQYGTVAHIERRVPVRNNGWVGRVCCWRYWLKFDEQYYYETRVTQWQYG